MCSCDSPESRVQYYATVPRTLLSAIHLSPHVSIPLSSHHPSDHSPHLPNNYLCLAHSHADTHFRLGGDPRSLETTRQVQIHLRLHGHSSTAQHSLRSGLQLLLHHRLMFARRAWTRRAREAPVRRKLCVAGELSTPTWLVGRGRLALVLLPHLADLQLQTLLGREDVTVQHLERGRREGG